MKLLVIVLCLLSERFLVHVSAHHRFDWFSAYSHSILRRLPKASFVLTPWVILASLILPIILTVFLLFYFFDHLLFGFIGLVLNIVIFYYCLGPNNPFYPVRSATSCDVTHDEVGGYLAQVNGQLFSVIFWYILLGPLGVLAYRLFSISQKQEAVQEQASWITDILDWIPAKMTSLLYLLVGNFQAGFHEFSKFFFTPPNNNQAMLSVCGLQAAGFNEQEPLQMPRAETLVEHAVIVLLVLLAGFTMVAWL